MESGGNVSRISFFFGLRRGVGGREEEEKKEKKRSKQKVQLQNSAEL